MSSVAIPISTQRQYRIAVLAGDGIGPEVMAEAMKVMQIINKRHGGMFIFEEGVIGGAAYDVCGDHLPQETVDLCQRADAVLFGSVGGPVADEEKPKWKNGIRRSLLGLRQALRLSINLRPAVVWPSLASVSPLKDHIVSRGIDILIVRELLGDVYFGEHKTEGGKAIDVMEYTEDQIRPVVEYACRSARTRRKHVTVVDKANVLDTSRLWRKVASEVCASYPDITLEYMLIDNCAMQLVRDPSRFDVIATGNFYGDILSDEAAALPGSLGLMPSASLGERVHLFEPMGGSAPDIAGKGIANPIAQILSVALMLRHSFSLDTDAHMIEDAVQLAIQGGARTRDIACPREKTVSTQEMGDAICHALAHLPSS